VGGMEHKDKEELIEEIKFLRDKIKKYEEENEERVKSAGSPHREDHAEAVKGELRAIALQDISLEKMLSVFLKKVTLVPWYAAGPKGAIFLAGDDPLMLEMNAQRGLPAPLTELCASVPVGKCLCGRAAELRQAVFTESSKECHEDLCAQSHYSVPILSSSKELLGVIVLYVRRGYRPEKKEEEFLCEAADILSAFIERKKAEEALVQTEKLTVLGHFAGGLAHEINNPLAIIKGRVELLLMGDEKHTPEVEAVMETLKTQVCRIQGITARLLYYARKKKPHMDVLNMNSVVRSVPPMLSCHPSFHNVTWEDNLAEGLPMIRGDFNHLQIVFLNIGLNACQAMPEGGVLTMASGVKDGISLEVSIRDTGMGIEEKDMGKIFKPFFTTKDKNSGMGLFICRNIIEAHGGDIVVESKAGKGTKVKVLLPLAG
ncbi:MAG: ATP-binding protein, partial [Candidatus Omnitrophota bacterium]